MVVRFYVNRKLDVASYRLPATLQTAVPVWGPRPGRQAVVVVARRAVVVDLSS